MGLHQNRHFHRLGLPEFVAFLLISMAVISAAVWWDNVTRPRYAETPGKVESCEIRLTHYNATNHLSKVTLSYSYSVGGLDYKGSWEGYWPQTDSPNALAADKLHVLETRDYPLVVLYEPANPAVSQLHYPEGRPSALYGVVAGLSVLAVLGYLAIAYPAWKRWEYGGSRGLRPLHSN